MRFLNHRGPAFALALLVFAGCLGNKGSDTNETSSTTDPTTNPTNGTTTPGPGPDGNATIPQIRWEDCTGVIGVFDAPRDKARDIVPAAFELNGETPQTASFRFYAFHCDRVVYLDHVVQDGGMFQLIAEVELVNESWGPGRPSLYVVDSLTTSQELADAAALLGATAKVAPLTRTPEAGPSGTQVERWKFEGSGVKVELEYVFGGQQGPSSSNDPLQWYSLGEQLKKVETEKTYTNDQIIQQGGLLRTDGPLTASPVLMNSCCTEWNGEAYYRFTEVWTANNTSNR